ncbi:MarR family winged helix-turn-helix transcriptional regulator [Actinokineospora auranticolor]|uniref:DNA-binding MarR family transcriptional regulator n=1 Tax=Actinokineospora auranticolor TaxID=155976 RepID=A0A2S6GS50_9PSEU|nr:MarR family winged helix-turn-helix transcriptional regulator [Actinokineospora auranticolor]PPK68054.1 DNA-binding MarR family transcriptional regulator [Actinokineospora auranticolor]
MSDQDDVALVERAMVAIRRLQARRALGALSGRDHTPAATAVVDVVEDQEPCTVGAVAAALAVDQPRASRLVAAAVEAGLVERRADQSDGRRTLLALTRAGRAHADEVHRFRQGVFAEAMADWPPDKRAAFAGMLTDFVDAYTALVRR